ncbi:MAG: hypothetical protein CVV02_00310 [Firmicutes bacterium HGW-Firmicutes-7]|nr:MAG: hypothetical protein CVV02_00310 [Firmicutes bacterium HGW-Firmicutes-7]
MKKIIMVLAVLIMLSTPMASSYAQADVTVQTNVEYEKMFKEVMEFLRESYVEGDKLTDKQLFEAAMKGMFNELDAYSEFMTPEESEQFVKSLNSNYVGIGVQLSTVGDYIGITKVFKGSPALAAGVETGDYFVNVDGVDVKGYSSKKLLDLVLGEEGTNVKITFGRGGSTYNVNIKRALISIPTVESVKVTDLYEDLNSEEEAQIAYISISSFSKNTGTEFEGAIEEAKTAGAKYLILDMRNNSGGYVSTAVKVSQSIVPKGGIVHFVNSNGIVVDHTSTLESAPFEIVVLVNEYSASATEFVAAAIQESNAGKIVGERTYGKGVAQYSIPYGQDYTIKLTMEEFFTRDYNKINHIGVKPDYFVEIPDYIIGDAKYYLYDNLDGVTQVEKVLDFLGYDVGTPDANYDMKTFNAVKKFQIDNGLYGYGICDFTTQTKLNEVMIKSIEKNDPQFNKAIQLILGKIHKK